jgi:hypothetical protein
MRAPSLRGPTACAEQPMLSMENKMLDMENIR